MSIGSNISAIERYHRYRVARHELPASISKASSRSTCRGKSPRCPAMDRLLHLHPVLRARTRAAGCRSAADRRDSPSRRLQRAERDRSHRAYFLLASQRIAVAVPEPSLTIFRHSSTHRTSRASSRRSSSPFPSKLAAHVQLRAGLPESPDRRVWMMLGAVVRWWPGRIRLFRRARRNPAVSGAPPLRADLPQRKMPTPMPKCTSGPLRRPAFGHK